MASVDGLHRHLPAPVSADMAQFYQLRAAVERLQQQLAAHDRQRHLTPQQTCNPVPFLNPNPVATLLGRGFSKVLGKE